MNIIGHLIAVLVTVFLVLMFGLLTFSGLVLGTFINLIKRDSNES